MIYSVIVDSVLCLFTEMACNESRNSQDTSLMNLIIRHKNSFTYELEQAIRSNDLKSTAPADAIRESLKNSFRNDDVTDSGVIDALFWKLISESDNFWAAMSVTLTFFTKY